MPTARVGLRVAPSTWQDRQAIYDLLMHSGIFGRTDAECVDGMFNEAFNKPVEDNYQFLSCWESGQEGDRLLGFACYGRESMTHGTWDLFWMCVSSAARRMGVGRALLDDVQRRAAQAQVRLIVIYTSSTDPYAPARGLYEAAGFARTAVIPDYYAPGDDLYIYTWHIQHSQHPARKE